MHFVATAVTASDLGRISPTIAWCNQNLPAGESKLLLIGEAKAFDFEMPIVFSTCFNRSPAEVWLKGRPVDEQRKNLQDAKITHVMINWSEIARYRSPGNYGFSDWPTHRELEQLVADGVLKKVEVACAQRVRGAVLSNRYPREPLDCPANRCLSADDSLNSNSR